MHSRELTILKRDELRSRWKEEREKANPKIAHDGQFSKVGRGRGNRGGFRQAARELGVPLASLNRSLKVAALPMETRQGAAELGLANSQRALLAAAKETAPEALAAILEARAPPRRRRR